MTELLDSIASKARTALDDPLALDPDEYQERAPREYAIDKLDCIIEALNPSWEDRETFAASLTAIGRQLEDRRERIASLTPDTEPPDSAAYWYANCELTEALDHIDNAIRAMLPEEED